MEALVISGWTVISSIGIGVEAYRKGLAEATKPQNKITSEVPFSSLYSIVDFDVRSFLGKKGTRNLDRTTGLSIAALKELKESFDFEEENEDSTIGIVLGTSTGSYKSIMDYTLETWENDRPYLVNPALFPNTVMNSAAGYSAIWHGLKGPNVTVSGGKFSSVSAIQYAATSLKQNYADILLTGSVEEYSELSAEAYQILHEEDECNLGEGAVYFALETLEKAEEKDRKYCAQILHASNSFCFWEDEDLETKGNKIKDYFLKILEENNVLPAEIDFHAIQGNSCQETNSLEKELASLIESKNPNVIINKVSETIGDTYSCSMGFQITTALDFFESSKKLNGYALITGLNQQGCAGFVLLKKGNQ